jgi:hypothetical protein
MAHPSPVLWGLGILGLLPLMILYIDGYVPDNKAFPENMALGPLLG